MRAAAAEHDSDSGGMSQTSAMQNVLDLLVGTKPGKHERWQIALSSLVRQCHTPFWGLLPGLHRSCDPAWGSRTRYGSRMLKYTNIRFRNVFICNSQIMNVSVDSCYLVHVSNLMNAQYKLLKHEKELEYEISEKTFILVWKQHFYERVPKAINLNNVH